MDRRRKWRPGLVSEQRGRKRKQSNLSNSEVIKLLNSHGVVKDGNEICV